MGLFFGPSPLDKDPGHARGAFPIGRDLSGQGQAHFFESGAKGTTAFNVTRIQGSRGAVGQERNKLSLVEVFPSTETQLNVPRATSESVDWSVLAGSPASVKTTDNIVAMLGWIMPAPLAHPQTV